MSGVDESLARIDARVEDVRRRVAAAARAAGRSSDTVHVLAVTKGHTLAEARRLFDLGFRAFGENRVQEARVKYGVGDDRPAWVRECCLSLIGHLQSNKVKLARDCFQLIQSVDRDSVARQLDEGGAQPCRIMVEVNAGREPQKYGLWPEAVESFVEGLAARRGITTVGLLIMLPQAPQGLLERTMDEARALWEGIRRHEWPWAPCDTLSMGMSDDFELAIRHGSNEVRIGTALLGPRMAGGMPPAQGGGGA
jgi:pyridoxal phosphate enzyme (YggS family)